MGKEKQPKILEKNITKDIRALLKQYNIFHYKAWAGLGSVKGVADLIGVMPINSKIPGAFLAVEVKTERGRLSPHQENFLRSISDSGGISFVARSLDDVIKNLRGYL
jgi:hypothetical protein